MDDSKQQMAENAKALLKSAAMFDELLEAQHDMLDEGMLPDDEDSETLEEHMETARDTCKLLSMSITVALAEKGYVVDFDEDDDDTPSKTFE